MKLWLLIESFNAYWNEPRVTLFATEEAVKIAYVDAVAGMLDDRREYQLANLLSEVNLSAGVEVADALMRKEEEHHFAIDFVELNGPILEAFKELEQHLITLSTPY